MSLRLVLLAALPLVPLVVQAGEMPKEGTDSFTNTWVVTASNSVKLGDRSLLIYELTGVSRNDDGGAMFNNMGLHCVGMVEYGSPEQPDHGACTFTDKDGDQIFGKYDSKGDGKGKGGEVGGYPSLAGTGKFAGISGTIEFVVTGELIKSDDKFFRGVVAHKAH